MEKLSKQEYFNRLMKASWVSFTAYLASFISIVVMLVISTVVNSLNPVSYDGFIQLLIVLVGIYAIGVFALAVHHYVSDSLDIYIRDNEANWKIAFIYKTIEENPQIDWTGILEKMGQDIGNK